MSAGTYADCFLLTTTCALCSQTAVRRKSHIIPDFVVAYIRSLGLVSSILTRDCAGKPVQQAFQKLLLGDCCEQLFSNWEGAFAKNVFHSYSTSGSVKPGALEAEWFQKLSISLAWRAAAGWLEDETDILEVDRRLILDAMTSWREYLLFDAQTVSRAQWYFFSCSNVQAFADSALETELNYPDWFLTYLISVAEYGIVSESNFFGVFVKLPFMAMWVNIFPDRITGLPPKQFIVRGMLQRPDVIQTQVMKNAGPERRNRLTARILMNKTAEELTLHAATPYGQARLMDAARSLKRAASEHTVSIARSSVRRNRDGT